MNGNVFPSLMFAATQGVACVMPIRRMTARRARNIGVFTMLTVTDDAKAHIADLLDQNDAPEGTAVRLVPAQQGLALAPDSPTEDDTTFDHNGRTVLVIKPTIAEQLDGRTIDVAATDQGKELRLS